MPETRTPGPVPQDALDYWRAKDLRPGFSYEDVWADEHAHSFTVAKMTRLDLLEDTRASLEDALAEGKTFRQWSNEIRPRLQAKGWWGIKDQIDPATGITERVQLGSPRRLKTIYRANMRSARAAGQWQRIQRTKTSRPYLVYLLGPSREHRDAHVQLQGLIRPVDDPVWQEIYPPNGYGCKCHVNQIDAPTRDRYAADGVPDATAEQEINPSTGLPTGRRIQRTVPAKTEPPMLKRREYVNKRTGEVTTAPEGVHPAWANNSGQARVRVIREALTTRVDAAQHRLTKQAALDVIDSDIFDQFRVDVGVYRVGLENNVQAAIDAVGELPLGALPNDLRQAVGSQVSLVRLSGFDMAKQDRSDKRPNFTRRDYLAVQDLLEQGVAVRQGNRLVVFLKIDRRYWQAVIKASADRRKLYLNSYHIADKKTFRRAMRSAKKTGNVVRSAYRGS